ncbi:MAG: hypothetical protein GX675_04995 [Erysipelotrichaceae bacterium]|nr:hypothetical protein [Erysipelotrichaceae bacterium]
MKKNLVTVILSLCMVALFIPLNIYAENNEKYEEISEFTTTLEDTEIHVYMTKGAGTVTLTDHNEDINTFPISKGYREYNANANQGWVFKGWTFEQWFEGNDLGNDTETILFFATKYSFSPTGENSLHIYNGGKKISINRLSSRGETSENIIIYKIFANFNPIITPIAYDGGAISPSIDKEVDYGSNLSLDIVADTNKCISYIKIDDVEIDDGKDLDTYTYTFTNITKPHKIEVFFKTKVFTVTYKDGFDGSLFQDKIETDLETGSPTPQFGKEPSKEGYRFTGWSPEISDIVNGNQIYTATWERTYTVTYKDGVGGSLFQDKIETDLNVGDPTPKFEGTPTRLDYSFLGWSPEVSETVSGDQVYTATWKFNFDDSSQTSDTTTYIATPYYEVVNTSEETTMYIWIVLIVLSSAAIIAINLKKRKK